VLLASIALQCRALFNELNDLWFLCVNIIWVNNMMALVTCTTQNFEHNRDDTVLASRQV
jgi:hypothetical protein